MGSNMSVPYGSWMGSVIEDSFHPPHGLATEVQTFLADHEDLISRESGNEVAVVYSVESTRELIGKADASDNITNARDESVVVPYRVVTGTLAGAAAPFDIVIFPDGVTAPDLVDVGALERYRTVILPDCHVVTERQAQALTAYLAQGGTLAVVGRFGESLAKDVRDRLTGHEGVRRARMDNLAELLPHGPQVELSTPHACASNVHQLPGGAVAVHLVNYDYDREQDRVRTLTGAEVSVRIPVARQHATLVTSVGERQQLELRHDDGRHVVAVEQVGVYAILVLHDGEHA
jgi:hypothetical protein